MDISDLEYPRSQAALLHSAMTASVVLWQVHREAKQEPAEVSASAMSHPWGRPAARPSLGSLALKCGCAAVRSPCGSCVISTFPKEGPGP